MCATFPGAGTPSQYYGLDREFSDWICAEIDKGLAQYKNWYDGRREEMQKSGRHSYRPKYRTLNELLGITEALRRGGFSGADLTNVSKLYLEAVKEASRRGEPPPDAQEWFERYKDGEIDEDGEREMPPLPPGALD